MPQLAPQDKLTGRLAEPRGTGGWRITSPYRFKLPSIPLTSAGPSDDATVRAADYTAFSARVATAGAIDLTAQPLARDAGHWTHPRYYAACQSLADAARMADLAAILYRSVRDPEGGRNIALLTPKAFANPRPLDRQTWRIRLSPTGVQAICDYPAMRVGFRREVCGWRPAPRRGGQRSCRRRNRPR